MDTATAQHRPHARLEPIDYHGLEQEVVRPGLPELTLLSARVN
jgi:hypothetical protein